MKTPTQHTPGPWKICKDTQDGSKVVCFNPFGASAVICGKEKESNAILIAAAPELLAALELCVGSSRARLKLDLKVWETMQAAIAKAKGQQAG